MTPSFKIAFDNTVAHEGGYVNRDDDRGGETFKGITRRWFPDWLGWVTIDCAQDKSTLLDNTVLDGMVEDFYLSEFWDAVKGYALEDQALANLLFDTAVHTGAPDANKYLQAALNFCNRNERLYNDLTVDGLIGPVTLSALKLIVGQGEVWAVTGYAVLLRGEATLIDLRETPEQEINAVGWVDRLISFNNQ